MSANDPGKFDLGINGTTYANSEMPGSANGGETGFQVVPVGDAKVFENGHSSDQAVELLQQRRVHVGRRGEDDRPGLRSEG